MGSLGSATVVVPARDSDGVVVRGGVPIFCWDHIEHMASFGSAY
jgi:hypothetical protein